MIRRMECHQRRCWRKYDVRAGGLEIPDADISSNCGLAHLVACMASRMHSGHSHQDLVVRNQQAGDKVEYEVSKAGSVCVESIGFIDPFNDNPVAVTCNLRETRPMVPASRRVAGLIS